MSYLLFNIKLGVGHVLAKQLDWDIVVSGF